MKAEEIKKNGVFENGEYVYDLKNGCCITYNELEKLFYIKCNDKNKEIVTDKQGFKKIEKIKGNENLLKVFKGQYYVNIFNCKEKKLIFNGSREKISWLDKEHKYLLSNSGEIYSSDGEIIRRFDSDKDRWFKMFENNSDYCCYLKDYGYGDFKWHIYNLKEKRDFELPFKIDCRDLYMLNKQCNLVKVEGYLEGEYKDYIFVNVPLKIIKIFDLNTGKQIDIPQLTTNISWLNQDETLLKVGVYNRNSYFRMHDYGVWDFRCNKMIIGPYFQDITCLDEKGNLLLLRDKNNKLGLYNVEKCTQILPCEYKEITKTKDGNIKARKSLSDYKLITKDGTNIEKTKQQSDGRQL